MQKFAKGDLIQIAKDLGPCMRHFTADCRGIVVGTYAQQYGGNNIKAYTIYLEGHGEVSWYEEHQLTLLEAGRSDLLQTWRDEAARAEEQESDPDWIFSNGEAILKKASNATVEKLAAMLGITNLWGSHGEGATYYMNAIRILEVASPFLKTGDRAGFEKFCEEVKSRVRQ